MVDNTVTLHRQVPVYVFANEILDKLPSQKTILKTSLDFQTDKHPMMDFFFALPDVILSTKALSKNPIKIYIDKHPLWKDSPSMGRINGATSRTSSSWSSLKVKPLAPCKVGILIVPEAYSNVLPNTLYQIQKEFLDSEIKIYWSARCMDSLPISLWELPAGNA